MANPSLPMRPYTSGLNRGAGAPGGLGGASNPAMGQNARMERERAERERLQREQQAAAAPAHQQLPPPRIEDLSEEQREEINEAVCVAFTRREGRY